MSLSHVQKAKKPLTLEEFIAKANANVTTISDSRILHQSERLTCPYDKCAKTFEKPVVLTDLSRALRETYYACPHCFSKLEIAPKSQDSLSSVSVETSENADVAPPRECSHYLGYLTTLQKEDSIPDECLTCSKLMQCTVRK